MNLETQIPTDMSPEHWGSTVAQCDEGLWQLLLSYKSFPNLKGFGNLYLVDDLELAQGFQEQEKV